MFFYLHLHKRLSKQSLGWWFEMLSCPLWCHRNALEEHTTYLPSIQNHFPVPEHNTNQTTIYSWTIYTSILQNIYTLQMKLEQLERLRSEDTPRRLMITHTIESYRIPSQNENIGQGQRSLHATHPLMLIMICAKYGKTASRIVDFFQGESWKIRKICDKLKF